MCSSDLSITSTIILDKPGLAFGNVFGSNLFNIVILAVADLIFIKHLFFNQNKSGIKTNALVIIMYIVFILPLLLNSFGWLDYDALGITIGITFNVISIIIIILYFLSIKSMNEEESTTDGQTSKLSYKRIGIMFALWSIVIISSSFFVTLVTNEIAIELNLSTSFAGAIFLGVATSLPELTAVITDRKSVV